MDFQSKLSRREREIMDIIYARGEASVIDVMAAMEAPPTRSALGRLVAILEEKGHLERSGKGPWIMYRPTVPVTKAGPSAMRRVVDTFFGGSLREAMAAHLAQDVDISNDELKRMAELIRQAQHRERLGVTSSDSSQRKIVSLQPPRSGRKERKGK